MHGRQRLVCKYQTDPTRAGTPTTGGRCAGAPLARSRLRCPDLRLQACSSQSYLAPATSQRSERRAAGRAAQLPLRLQEGNLISLPERRRATRCLWCCNIIESAPLGRATRRQRGRGGRGGASRRSGKGWTGGGFRGPLDCHPRQGTPRSNHLPGRPRPNQSFATTASPGATPEHFRALPRQQSQLSPARARAAASVASGRPRAPRFSSLTPAGPGTGRWRPSRAHKLGEGTSEGTPATTPHPRAHLSCQDPAALPRLTHAGATVARVCLNCLSHPGLCGGGSAARGGGASGAWAKKHLLLSPLRTHPSATPPTPRPRLAPGALTSAGGRCRVSAASARARTDGPPGAPSAVTTRRVGAAPALLATLAGQSRGISQRPRGPLISKSREEWLTTRLPYPSLIAASPSAWNSAWHLATH